MPPKSKRRKSLKKKELPEEFLREQNHQKELLRGRKMSKTKSRRVQARNVPLYFHDTHARSSSDYFNKSTSEDESDESLVAELERETLKCQDCEYKTSLRTLLERHADTHAKDRPFACAACGHRFRTQSNLKRHKRRHSETKSLQCSYCNSTYRNNSELVRHIRYKHTHEKPFKCTDCDSAYVERSKLIRHISSHPIKLRQCFECSYTYYETSDLLRHLRTHATKKLYRCEICDKTYNQPQNLKIHTEQMHPVSQTSEYYCSMCSLHFLHTTDLQAHMRKLHTNLELCENSHHTINKPTINKTYECNDCGLAFAQIRNLINHIMICDRKPGHKKKLPEQEEKPFDIKQDQKSSSELRTISNYLIRGEVILLPATDADKYIMIKVMSDENDKNQQTAPQDLGHTVKKEIAESYEVEIKCIKSEVKSERDFEIKDEIIDEEIEPFFGFDLKDIQSATTRVHQLKVEA